MPIYGLQNAFMNPVIQLQIAERKKSSIGHGYERDTALRNHF
jgi:hypothetical protein